MAESVPDEAELLDMLERKGKYKRQNSVTKKANQVISILSSSGSDPDVQLQCVSELCQMLVMGDESTLSGFPVATAVPLLIVAMKSESVDLSMVACRALCYMMDVLPVSVHTIVRSADVFVEKLQVISCLDVAEQTLVALEKLSVVHCRPILEMGGVSAALMYFDFLPAASQCKAISVVANCTKAANERNFPTFIGAIPILTQRLQLQDVKLVEKSISCFSRLISNLSHHPMLLEEICSHGLLPSLQQLLVVSPPVLVESTFVMVFRMLSKLCSRCPPIAVELMKICIGETLHYLMTEDKISLVGKTMITSSPSEFSEFISLLSELLPPLPMDGIFEINSDSSHSPIGGHGQKVVWLWQNDQDEWLEFDNSSHQLIEEAVNNEESNAMLLINGQTYSIDFASMKQFNVQSGHARNVKKVDQNPSANQSSLQTDSRYLLWQSNPQFYDDFIKRMFHLIYEAHVKMEHPFLKLKSLQCILRNVYYARKDTLLEILNNIPISSHLSMLLKDSELRIVVGCLQLSDVLMQMLPDIFHVYFRREGVMNQMREVHSHCQSLARPKASTATTPEEPPTTSEPVTTQEEPPTTSEPVKTDPVLPSSSPSSGLERFSNVIRRSSIRLKRLLSRREHSSDSNEEPSPAPMDVSKLIPPAPKQPKVPRRLQKHALWIVAQSDRLLSSWNFSDSLDSHEAFLPLKRLQFISAGLESQDQLSRRRSLEELRVLFSSSETCPTSFEMMHCSLTEKLLQLLTDGCHPTNPLWLTNIQNFLTDFCGLETVDASPSLQHLLRQLHLCLNHVERFPVVTPSLLGSKDVRSMSFLSSRHISCQLEKHPSDVACKKLKVGTIRIHPLASIKAVESFLLAKGCCPKSKVKSEAAPSSSRMETRSMSRKQVESQEPDESGHTLELLVGDQVLSYHMTVVEALLQSAGSSSILPHSFWGQSHVIYYRKLEPGLYRSTSVDSQGTEVARFSSDSSFSDGQRGEQLSTRQKQLVWLCNQIAQSFPQSSELQYLVLRLLRVIYLLQSGMDFILTRSSCDGNSENTSSSSHFVNHYLASKVSRQLQDGLMIMTEHFSWWLTALPRMCPFLFPFDVRLKLFYITSFGRERAIIKMQETQGEGFAVESHEKVFPQLEKCRRQVKRQGILPQADAIFKDLAVRKMLEIEYENEVGIGSGPTMEFYTLVTSELQRADLGLWRGDVYEAYDMSAEVKRQYLHSKNGLFPAPLPATATPEMVQLRCQYFNLMGRLLARTLLDSRLINIDLCKPFCKWMLGMSDAFTLADLKEVDSTFASSFAYLQELAASKNPDEARVSIESLSLYFTLPGNDNMELKPGGVSLPVTYESLHDYLELVFDWVMMRGVERQFTALKEGFNSVFPIAYLSIFHPDEIPLLLCGNQRYVWSMKELQEHVKLDHGYTYDSKVVSCFFQILTAFSKDEQERFLQFVTGSPRLPLGGFSSLSPPLTVVRKSIGQGSNPDVYLPSVMTCMNYLKLPHYSSLEVMRERILTALYHGQMSFHLS